MKRTSADTRKLRDDLASDLRHIAEEIRPLTDSLDSLHMLFQHVWQNRGELVDVLNGFSERVTVQCDRCSAKPSLTTAVENGWRELRKEEGVFWGTCPACQAEDENEKEILPAEILFCTCCDATSSTSLAQALRAGWQCIVDDEGNERGNYGGMCPQCIAGAEDAAFHQRPAEVTGLRSADGQAAKQKRFF